MLNLSHALYIEVPDLWYENLMRCVYAHQQGGSTKLLDVVFQLLPPKWQKMVPFEGNKNDNVKCKIYISVVNIAIIKFMKAA